MSSARYLAVVLETRCSAPLDLLVAALTYGLLSVGFNVVPPSTGVIPDWKTGLLEYENIARELRCCVRCVDVFGVLHVYARLSEADGSSVRTMTLRLDPGDFVYPAGLLTFNTLICEEQGLSVRLHELLVRINTALLYPLCFGPNAEIPSLIGLSDPLLRLVCAFLPAAELLSLDRCSRHCHAAASDHDLWAALGARDFPVKKHLMYHNLTHVNSKRTYLACSRQLYSRRKILSIRAQEGTIDYPWPGGGNRLSLPPFPPLSSNLSGGGTFF